MAVSYALIYRVARPAPIRFTEPVLTITPRTASTVVGLTSGRILQMSALDSGVRLFRTVASTRAFFCDSLAVNHRKTLVQFLVAHIKGGQEIFNKGEIVILVRIPPSRGLPQRLVIIRLVVVDLLLKGHMLRCPNWLEPEAKKEWRRLAPVLIGAGILTSADAVPFAGYCQAYARWKEAEEQVSRLGMVYKEKDTERVRPNPYIAIARSAFAEVKSLAAEFGLTPANRTAIIANALTAEKSKRELDPIHCVRCGAGHGTAIAPADGAHQDHREHKTAGIHAHPKHLSGAVLGCRQQIWL